jgi:hypothetical protein
VLEAIPRAPAGICLLGAFIVACIGTTPARPLEAVLLAPPNFNRELPRIFEAGPAAVAGELRAVLETRGVRVLEPDLLEIREVWESATSDVGTLLDARGDFDRALLDAAALKLAQAYRSRGQRFDALLLSYLESRTATISGSSASWDGVKRHVQIDRSKAGKDLWKWPNHEPAACVSLRVVAYAGDGQRLFERYGGLEVVHRYRSRDLAEIVRWDLFLDRAALREGIEIALAPLFQK